MSFLDNLGKLAGLGDAAKNITNGGNMGGVTSALGAVTGGAANMDLMGKLMEMVKQFQSNPAMLSTLSNLKGFIPDGMEEQAYNMVDSIPMLPEDMKNSIKALLKPEAHTEAPTEATAEEAPANVEPEMETPLVEEVLPEAEAVMPEMEMPMVEAPDAEMMETPTTEM
jgi:hypothetical protein